jgi:hypothetical protein
MTCANDFWKTYLEAFLNPALISSTSTDFMTGLKFWIFRVVLLREASALSLRPFLFNRVTPMTLCLSRHLWQAAAKIADYVIPEK